MLILLGLIFAAIMLSMPLFLISLYNRTKRYQTVLEQLEDRIISLEQQLEHQLDPSETQDRLNVPAAGGIDGIT